MVPITGISRLEPTSVRLHTRHSESRIQRLGVILCDCPPLNFVMELWPRQHIPATGNPGPACLHHQSAEGEFESIEFLSGAGANLPASFCSVDSFGPFDRKRVRRAFANRWLCWRPGRKLGLKWRNPCFSDSFSTGLSRLTLAPMPYSVWLSSYYGEALPWRNQTEP